jgi:hypothetical protein
VTTAVVEFLESDQARAWLSFDTLVVRHDSTAEIDPALPEMVPPLRSVPSRHGFVQPEGRPGSLVARWVPDPRGESGLICTWVPRAGTEASVSFDA